MRRLIFTNKVGNNENYYIVGSGVGSLNRFSKAALKRRASNNSSGNCCKFKPRKFIIGSLIDGYIKNATGTVKNISTHEIIETLNYEFPSDPSSI